MTFECNPFAFVGIVVGVCFAVFESGRLHQVRKMVDQCHMLDEWERQLKERSQSQGVKP